MMHTSHNDEESAMKRHPATYRKLLRRRCIVDQWIVVRVVLSGMTWVIQIRRVYQRLTTEPVHSGCLYHANIQVLIIVLVMMGSSSSAHPLPPPPPSPVTLNHYFWCNFVCKYGEVPSMRNAISTRVWLHCFSGFINISLVFRKFRNL